MRISDWSSDVCSSDLDSGEAGAVAPGRRKGEQRHHAIGLDLQQALHQPSGLAGPQRAVVQQDTGEDVVLPATVQPHPSRTTGPQAAVVCGMAEHRTKGWAPGNGVVRGGEWGEV